MVVTVRLHTTLRRSTPEGTLDRLMLELAEGATVQAILDEMGIVLRDDAVLLVVNNRVAGAETPLADGDEVRLIPAMSGGD
jgi:molybdopterin converting factor small subunit